MRRVREEVERPHALELVAALDEQLGVARERRRVARDVDDAIGRELEQPAHGARRHARAWRVNDHDIGRRIALGDQLARRLADIGDDELRVADAVCKRVLARALDGLLDDLDADHPACAACEREPDRAGAAVEVPDDLAPRQLRLLDRVAIEHVGHLGVRLQERARRHAQAEPGDHLFEDRSAEEGAGRDSLRRLGDAVVRRVEHADDAGGAFGQHRLQQLDLERGARRGHEDAEQLAGAHALADDEVAQVSGGDGLVVGVMPGGARPRDEHLSHRVPCVAREQADLERDDLLPAAGAVKAERGPLGRHRPGVLELVAIAELRDRGHDRLDRELAEAADPLDRIDHLALLVPELEVVGEILPATATAGAEVRARRLDASRPGLEPLDRDGLAVPALDLGDASPHEVAGQRALDEHDHAFVASHASAAGRERVDAQIELLPGSERRCHGPEPS